MQQHTNHPPFSFIRSQKLALFLFFAIALFLIPETFLKIELPYYKEVKFLLLLTLWLNLATCTINRLKRGFRPALFIHLGCLLTIAGCLAGNFGYVATVNIYEGDETTTAYRWDKESDFPLGFELQINDIHRKYYPTAVRIGVLENGEKKELFQIKTGESFTLANYTIELTKLNIFNKSVTLDVYENNQFLWSYETSQNKPRNETPLDFVLVGFQDPVLKRIWVDMEIRTKEERTQGIAEVNNPFIWQGIRFFNTANGTDPYGREYAGIQIVKDPGIPLVYLGFIIITVGCLFRLPAVFKANQSDKKQVMVPQ